MIKIKDSAKYISMSQFLGRSPDLWYSSFPRIGLCVILTLPLLFFPPRLDLHRVLRRRSSRQHHVGFREATDREADPSNLPPDAESSGVPARAKGHPSRPQGRQRVTDWRGNG